LRRRASGTTAGASTAFPGVPEPFETPDRVLVRAADPEALLRRAHELLSDDLAPGVEVGDPARLEVLLAAVQAAGLLEEEWGDGECWACGHQSAKRDRVACRRNLPEHHREERREAPWKALPGFVQRVACARCRKTGVPCDWKGRIPELLARRGGGFVQEVYCWLRLDGSRPNPTVTLAACTKWDLPPVLHAAFPAWRAEEERAAAERADQARRSAPAAGSSTTGSPSKKRKREVALTMLPPVPVESFRRVPGVTEPIPAQYAGVRDGLEYLAAVASHVGALHRSAAATSILDRAKLSPADEALGDRLEELADLAKDRARWFGRMPGGVRGRGGSALGGGSRAGDRGRPAKQARRAREPSPEPIEVPDSDSEDARGSGEEGPGDEEEEDGSGDDEVVDVGDSESEEESPSRHRASRRG